MNAAIELHGRVFDAIERWDNGICVSDEEDEMDCGCDSGPATRALLQAIYVHRPEGWLKREQPEEPCCVNCVTTYPCETIRVIAEDLGVKLDG